MHVLCLDPLVFEKHEKTGSSLNSQLKQCKSNTDAGSRAKTVKIQRYPPTAGGRELQLHDEPC